ncbi:MAG: response regulator [Desulfobacteraceae bacterium]|nr:MAG: response regulator [Desulfobacteraceae bacterium]
MVSLTVCIKIGYCRAFLQVYPSRSLQGISPLQVTPGGYVLVKSILAADDDYDYQLIIRLTLEAAGFKGSLNIVENGEDLMDFLHHQCKHPGAEIPDLIILDLDMPRKDGREALKEIKADPDLKSIPIVVLLISSPEEDQLCREFDCSFIQKPDSYSQWVNTMEAILKFYGNDNENSKRPYFDDLLP